MTMHIGTANSMSDLGKYFSGDLFQREVNYLIQNEWAKQVDDILWRRSKKGLVVTEQGATQLKEYVAIQNNASTHKKSSVAN